MDRGLPRIIALVNQCPISTSRGEHAKHVCDADPLSADVATHVMGNGWRLGDTETEYSHATMWWVIGPGVPGVYAYAYYEVDLPAAEKSNQ
ncbi:hypothetical protein [Brevibacillus sp. NRS-1366]|uniref:hypothetical protein n=1 Tax=Brevibacillus sp. NRS-1366 TaxID=3233899 RepID=UPI003D208DD3